MRLFATASTLALLTACTTADTNEPDGTRGAALSANQCEFLATQEASELPLETIWVPGADGLPSFCEVTATLSPVEGSNIGVVYRLPEEWNGNVLGIGGGAWLGNTSLDAARDGLVKGYAVMQTNAGHTSTNPWGNEWVVNPVQAADFSYRAIHEMTQAGKRVAARFYGQEHDTAVYSGCSTGGRMGLMEAQRFPADYDAVIVGAPVYTLQVQTSAVFRNQTFAQPQASFTNAELQMVQDAAVAACDADDGLEDGLINSPRSCSWQPRALQCEPGETEDCLSPQQVDALNTLYNGRRASDGSWLMHPMSRGGEASWGFFNRADGSGQSADPTRGGGLMGLQPVIFGARQVDWDNFSDANYLTVRNSDFAEMYEADDTDLSAFFERGGKLMLWHGENDAGPSPVLSNDYARAVLSDNPEASEQFGYYLVPGMGHCAGGPGADQIDYLAAMEDWLETGNAPDRLIGRKADSDLVRPHCAWPDVARYDGSGDANDPSSWSCVPRS
ncbi:tannase/feruloyl esterase family alpha/beta hydrolase [Aurantiacibacter poecillastricola]|uniref:tannase/feruloyl esterase family alpha/beta hydrolase n=1 Tax=Aurantiacibacter poecillastricola TaxID=3064385 RepID=UPI00273DEAA8|nr:tannase/feruloyl esterase family alpha/beta hydrolase [Aurantiacibacter sp. 219JJ12-13]MDP5262628.1 tannase/feruloyl esterase family alpha/beta hydrolase [Aurantiacibacter sp. 219JJ12-13]